MNEISISRWRLQVFPHFLTLTLTQCSRIPLHDEEDGHRSVKGNIQYFWDVYNGS